MSQDCGRQGWEHCGASLPSAGRELFDDPSYVNVQNLDKARQAAGGAVPPNTTTNGSAPRDLFDMSEQYSLLSALSPPSHLGPLSPYCLLFPSCRTGSWACIAPAAFPSSFSLSPPQSPLKMHFGYLRLPSHCPWLSSCNESPGSMAS